MPLSEYDVDRLLLAAKQRSHQRRRRRRGLLAVGGAAAVLAVALPAMALIYKPGPDKTVTVSQPSSTSSTSFVPATTTPTTVPVSTSSPGVSTTAAGSKRTTTTVGAHVDIELLRTNQRGIPHLDLRASVNGMVPQLYSDTDGHPVPGTEQDLYIRVFFGDGSPETGSDGGGVSCKPGAPLVPIHMTSDFSHDYATSGSYTVSYKIAVCQLGVVTKTTTVTA